MLINDEETAHELAADKTLDQIAEELNAHQRETTGKDLSRGKLFTWWRVLLSTLVIISVTILLLPTQQKNYSLINLNTAEDLLFGGYRSGHEDKTTKAKDQWQADPTNPELLMQYVINANTEKETDTWKYEIIAQASEIDPENSYYNYWIAGEIANKNADNSCLKRVASTRDSSVDPSVADITEWQILDQEKYELALQHIIKGSNKKGIIKHGFIRQLDQLSPLKEMKENGEMDKIIMYSAFIEFIEGQDSITLNLIKSMDLFDIKFYELSKNGTTEEVRFWMNVHTKTINLILDQRYGLIDILVAKAVFQAPLGNMKAAAEHHGMLDEVKKLNELITQLDDENKKRQLTITSRSNNRHQPDHYSSDSMMTYLLKDALLNQVERPEEVIIPSENADRYSDHSLFGRIAILGCLMFFSCMTIGIWIFYFAKSKIMRITSIQALRSLTILDVLTVIIGGVILPIGLYLMVNESLSLGLSVREWNIMSAHGSLLGTQFLGMLLTLLTLSIALLRWRLSKRLPNLFRKERILGWILPVLSLTAMIIVGLSDKPDGDIPWSVGVAFISIVLLSWLVISGIGSFSKKHKFESVVMCRGLISIYSSIIVIFTGLYFYYEAQERQWVSKSEQFTFQREHQGTSAIEHEVCKQLLIEFQEKLDLLP